MITHARFGAVLLCLAAANVSLADVGGEPGSELDLSPFYLRVGTYFLGSSTTARVDGSAGNFGSRLSFENDLNLDKRKRTLLANARWRFHDRHFLEIEYFNLTRFGSKRIDEEIRFGDAVFPIGADLRSSFTTEVTRLGYSYRIVKRPEWGLALSAGLHVTRLRTSLDSLDFDNAGQIVLGREIASVTAPLPVFGVSAVRHLGGKWIVAARSQWFFLKVEDVEGAITHAAAYFEHDTFRNIGFGFGYDWFKIDVDTTDKFWRGAADVRFNGPLVFIQASF
jgi:hypothetical protein